MRKVICKLNEIGIDEYLESITIGNIYDVLNSNYVLGILWIDIINDNGILVSLPNYLFNELNMVVYRQEVINEILS